MASAAGLPTLAVLKSRLSQFISSSSTFKVITSQPSTGHITPPKTLFILDSSFNPPTIAHLHLALSALQTPSTIYQQPRRLLLLLTTQNADKPPAPAAYEHRLTMMVLFAKELRRLLAAPGDRDSSEENPAIDIALTSQPYFYLKSKLISDSGVYSDQAIGHNEPEHVHLIGYDTLIRLLDTKYYPPDHSLSVLEPLFSKHRLRVHMRPGEWGEVQKQVDWVSQLSKGELEKRGGKADWVDRIELVKAEEGKGVGVSSSRVRKEVGAGGSLDGLIPGEIKGYIAKEKLYIE